MLSICPPSCASTCVLSCTSYIQVLIGIFILLVSELITEMFTVSQRGSLRDFKLQNTSKLYGFFHRDLRWKFVWISFYKGKVNNIFGFWYRSVNCLMWDTTLFLLHAWCHLQVHAMTVSRLVHIGQHLIAKLKRKMIMDCGTRWRNDVEPDLWQGFNGR